VSNNGIYSTTYTFEYDQNNRLKKSTEISGGGFNPTETTIMDFAYSGNTITVTRSYEGYSDPTLSVYELTVDDKGRILRREIVQRPSGNIQPTYIEYSYDQNGNILEERTKEYNSNQVDVETYSYTNIRNPYYYAYKAYYTNLYYFEYFWGLVLFDDTGLTPFLMESEDKTYEVDADGFPVKLFDYNPYVNETYEIIYEYY